MEANEDLLPLLWQILHLSPYPTESPRQPKIAGTSLSRLFWGHATQRLLLPPKQLCEHKCSPKPSASLTSASWADVPYGMFATTLARQMTCFSPRVILDSTLNCVPLEMYSFLIIVVSARRETEIHYMQNKIASYIAVKIYPVLAGRWWLFFLFK